MQSTTVRIPERVRVSLRSLAETEGRSMQAVLEDAIEAYRRTNFLDRLNCGYASLSDAERQELRQELVEWDPSLQDGLSEF